MKSQGPHSRAAEIVIKMLFVSCCVITVANIMVVVEKECCKLV